MSIKAKTEILKFQSRVLEIIDSALEAGKTLKQLREIIVERQIIVRETKEENL